MMQQYISQNKNEYNIRMVEKLSSKLLKLEKELKETKKISQKIKLFFEIKKINKIISIHGSEVITFENNKINNK